MRRVYYLLRRHCQLSMAEVRALSWFEHRVLIEGLTEELGGEEAAAGEGGLVGTGSTDELGSLGLTVREA